MSGPVRLGGTSANRPASGVKQYMHADSNSLSGSSQTYRDFGRGPFLQALIDIGAVLACFVFIGITALSIPLAFFLMFFANF